MRRSKITWSICLILLSIWFMVQGLTHHFISTRIEFFAISETLFICSVMNLYREIKRAKPTN